MARQHVRTLNPSAVTKPPTTYHHVAITPIVPGSNLVTLAGQVGRDAASGILPTDFVQQAKNAYQNVLSCLSAAGASPRDIVHVRHYIVIKTGQADLDALDIVDRGWGELWVEFLDQNADGHRPPDTVLGVAGLARQNILYEIEVWAVIPGEDDKA